MKTRQHKKRKFTDIKTDNKKCKSLDTLYTMGFQIFKNHINIPPKVSNHLIKLTESKGSAIFNHNEKSTKNDRKRIQVNINPKLMYMLEFMDQFNQILKSMFPHLEPNDPVVIGSKPGCKAQAAHIDYPPPDGPMDPSKVSINVILALQDDTHLNVWPKSHQLVCWEKAKLANEDEAGDPIHMETVHMNQGDMLLFRGDLVHGGASYDKANYRIHCYLDYESRIPNRTWLIHRHGSDFLRKMIVID